MMPSPLSNDDLRAIADAHERLYAIYREFYAQFGPEPVPESAEIAYLWSVIENAE
jgi:hypothetical protein